MEHEHENTAKHRMVHAGFWLRLIPAAALAALLLAGPVLGWELCAVQSGSMEPALPVGSLLLVVPEPQPRPGQIITFVQGQSRVTHRVAAQNPDGSLVTQGDANAAPDAGAVQPEQVEGRVALCLPLLGWPTLWVQGSPLRGVLPVLAGALFVLALWPQKRKEEPHETQNPFAAVGGRAGAHSPDHRGGALGGLVHRKQQPGREPLCSPGTGHYGG